MKKKMQPQIAPETLDEQTEFMRLNTIWQEIQQQLEAEKVRIVEEIGQYPHPIPACDAQFNSLLEERVAILQELGDVKGVFKQSLTIREHIKLLNKLVQSSRYLDGHVEEQVRQLTMMFGQHCR
jgi:hypothetical protein